MNRQNHHKYRWVSGGIIETVTVEARLKCLTKNDKRGRFLGQGFESAIQMGYGIMALLIAFMSQLASIGYLSMTETGDFVPHVAGRRGRYFLWYPWHSRLSCRIFALLPDPDVELLEPGAPGSKTGAAPVPAGRCGGMFLSDRVLVRFSFISSNFLAHRVFRSHEVGLLMSMGRSPHTTQRKQALIGIK